MILFCFSEAKNHYLSHSLICWAGQIGSGTSWDDENAWPPQCGEIISEIINRFEIFQKIQILALALLESNIHVILSEKNWVYFEAF